MRKVIKFGAGVILAALVLLTIFWFVRPSDIRLEDIARPIPFQAYSHLITIDHVRLHFQEKGEGPVLVLIHGYGSSTYTWKQVFNELAGRFRVIAIDLKGFGFSEKPAGDYSVAAQAGLVLDFLRQLEIERATLCGSSMGGAVALLCALKAPHRITRLILVDSATFTEVGRQARLVPPLLMRPVIGTILAALALTSRDLVRRGLRRSFYDKSLITPERLEAYYRPLRTRGGQQAALATARQWNLSAVETNLRRIQQPTLILWGAEDQLIPLRQGERLHRQMKDSRLVILPKCGHLPQVEKPHRFAQQVIRFMSRQ